MSGDYIGWGIGIIGIGLTVYCGLKMKKLKNQNIRLEYKSQQVHNIAETIIQNNYIVQGPLEIKEKMELIINNTGTSVNMKNISAD